MVVVVALIAEKHQALKIGDQRDKLTSQRCLGTKTSKQFTNVVIRFLRFRGPMDIGKVCDTLRSETAEHRSACQIRLASAIIFRFQFQCVASACRSVPRMWEPPPAAYKIAGFRISRIDTMSRRKRSETSNG